MKVVFEEYFRKSEGKPFIYNGNEIKLLDKINLSSGKVNIKAAFLSVKSEWRQGFVLKTKGSFEVNSQKIPKKIVLWEHTAPKQFDIVLHSKDQVLLVYNVWETGDGTIHSWHSGGALLTEILNGGATTIYHCNDGHPDDDFDNLIFKLEFSNQD